MLTSTRETHTDQENAEKHAMVRGGCFAHVGRGRQGIHGLEPKVSHSVTVRVHIRTCACAGLAAGDHCHLMHSSENYITWRSRLHPPRKTRHAGDGFRPDSLSCACNIRRVKQQATGNQPNSDSTAALGWARSQSTGGQQRRR